MNHRLVGTSSLTTSLPARVGRTRLLVGILVLLGLFGVASSARAEFAWGVTPQNVLFLFDTAAPGTLELRPAPLTGLLSGESIVAMNVRPKTGELYAIGRTGTFPAHVWTLYVLDPFANSATTVGTLPVTGQVSAMAFDPVLDRLRVATNADPVVQWLIDPVTAAVEFTGSISVPELRSLAYANAHDGTDRSTLFGIFGNDTGSPALARVGDIDAPDSSASQNAGVTTPIGQLDPNLLPGNLSFAIAEDGTVGYAVNAGYGGTARFYRINLATGAATQTGILGTGATVDANTFVFTLARRAPTLYAINTLNQLVAFRAIGPSAVLDAAGQGGGTPRPITGLADSGEQLVTLDVRPADGRLYAASDRGRLYRLDPSTAAATLVSTLPSATVSGSDVRLDIDPREDLIHLFTGAGFHLLISPDDGVVRGTVAAPAGTLSPTFAANLVDGTAPTLYVIRPFDGDQPAELASIHPLSGAQTSLGTLAVSSTNLTGVDTAPTNGVTYASFTAPGESVSYLYTLNPSTRAVTPVGSLPIGGGAAIRDITVAGAGYLQFGQWTYDVTEGPNAPLQVQVVRVGGSDNVLTARVGFQTNAGLTAGVDYTPAGSSFDVTFAAGDTAPKTVTVGHLIDNATAESVRLLRLQLTKTMWDSPLGLGARTNYLSQLPVPVTTVVVEDDDSAAAAGVPLVRITSPTTASGYQAPGGWVTLSATADDAGGTITNLWWKDEWTNHEYPVDFGAPTSHVEFTASASMSEGRNTITVRSLDNAGNSRSDSIVILHREGRAVDDYAVTITTPTAGSTFESVESSIVLSGTASWGTADIFWSSDRLAGGGRATGDTSWTTPSIALLPGVNQIVISALTRGGTWVSDSLTVNVTDPSLSGAPILDVRQPTTGTTYTTYDDWISWSGIATDPGGRITTMTWSIDMYAGSGEMTYTSAPPAAQVEWQTSAISLWNGTNVITITAVDDQGLVTSKTITVTKLQHVAPYVQIVTPTPAPTYETTAESIALGGTAAYEEGTVNTMFWTTDRSSTGGTIAVAPPATLVNWTTTVPLLAGANAITVHAVTSAGQSVTDTVTLTRTVSTPGTPPTVVITSPTTASTYEAAGVNLLISGTARDTGGTIVSMSWSSDRIAGGVVSLMPPGGAIDWLTTVTLLPGANTITITALDNDGQSANDTLLVTYAEPHVPRAPLVTLSSPSGPQQVSTATIALAGAIVDEDQDLVEAHWISDRSPAGGALSLTRQPVPGTVWTFTSTASLLPGVNQISIVATDATGLTHSVSVAVTYTVPDPDPDPVVTPPVVGVETPSGTSSFTSAGFFSALRGTASGARVNGVLRPVTSVAWTNDRGGSGTATLSPSAGTPGAMDWIINVLSLSAGLNTVTITVTDDTARTTSSSLAVTVAQPTYYLAEGATGFFKLDILLANPNDAPAPVRVQFVDFSGPIASSEQTFVLEPQSRRTLTVNDLPGMGQREVSTIVTSTSGLPIIVERTMEWDKEQRYGSATDHAAEGLSKTWYFAEGAQNDFFQTYLLLANPTSESIGAEIRYLRAGLPDLLGGGGVGPFGRQTIDLGSIPELRGQTFGIEVIFDKPGVAERAMYFNGFIGGHESAGVTQPSRTWFLAEGATGFFQTYVLLANPSRTTATVAVDFLLPGGGIVHHPGVTLPAGQRESIDIASVSPQLRATAVSTSVRSDVPIVVERAQYWPSGAAQGWNDAHNSFGLTEPGRRWGLAEGRVGGPTGYSTYILLANPNPVAASGSIRFLRENGLAPILKPFTVPPNGRFTVLGEDLAVPELVNERFGAVISSDEPIVVERAMYSNALGVIWQAGSNATATRLPATVP